MLPQPLLAHLGQQLAIAVPDIASVCALYHRERTLYEHQIFASDLLRFRSLSAHGERGLVAHLRKEAATVSSPQALLTSAYRWLYEHRYIIPRRRRIQDRVRQSVRHTEQQLLQAIAHEVPADTRKRWMQTLLSSPSDKEVRTAWEWLRTAPGQLALDEQARLKVVGKMYELRFGEKPPERRSVEQLRGIEGARGSEKPTNSLHKGMV